MVDDAPRYPHWSAAVVTLFPQMFPGPLGYSLAGRAQREGLWQVQTFCPRAHGVGPHRDVDDTPYGGGAGMVMRADVMAATIDDAAAALPPAVPRLLMSPRGRPLSQQRAEELADGPGALIVCARFEGIDERVIDARQLEEISVGDFVLSGGETAALIVLDAVVRLLPGVMGREVSHREESFQPGVAGDPSLRGLEHPQYTKPRTWEGHTVPDILLSGDHAKIAAWRQSQARQITGARRPDLLASPTSTQLTPRTPAEKRDDK